MTLYVSENSRYFDSLISPIGAILVQSCKSLSELSNSTALYHRRELRRTMDCALIKLYVSFSRHTHNVHSLTLLRLYSPLPLHLSLSRKSRLETASYHHPRYMRTLPLSHFSRHTLKSSATILKFSVILKNSMSTLLYYSFRPDEFSLNFIEGHIFAVTT